MPTIVVLADPPGEVRLRVEGYLEDLEGIIVGMVRGTGRLCRAYADVTRARAVAQHARRLRSDSRPGVGGGGDRSPQLHRPGVG